MNAQEIINAYDLTPHPEGGYFREIYRSKATVPSPAHGKPRAALTEIHFLLTRGQISRFHSVAHDEVWHFYYGSPLRLLSFDKNEVTEHVLGQAQNAVFTHIIPGGIYQAAESTGDFSLVGCTVAPGFDFEDFSFLSDTDDPHAMLPPNTHRFL